MVHFRFTDYLQFEKRYAPSTVRAYITDLDQFYSYLSTTYDLSEDSSILRTHVRSWIVDLVEHEISARSINRKLSSLKTYFKYLVKASLIKENPAADVVAPKVSKRLPAFVEKEHVDNLFKQEFFADDFNGVRNRMIFELFYATGMRQAELIGLQDSNIDLHGLTIKVLGKGNKERIIPINKELATQIKQYTDQRQSEFNGVTDSGHFFVTNKGVKLYPKFVYRLVNKYLSMITTIDKRSPHVLRHTFATHLSNNGADINAIKELLGHASLAATQVYTHNTIEQLMEVYKQTHPKA
jgi:integrase/recombinase XerC